MLIVNESSLKQFILEEINKTDSYFSLELQEYLSVLLDQYLLSESLFDSEARNGQMQKDTLVEMYNKTLQADPQERLHLLKKIGDLSLYWSGFFRSSLNRKLFHLSYYQDMGQSAYACVAGHYDNQDNIFSELSGHFKSLSETLFKIQKKSESQYQKSQYLLKSCKKA